MDSEDDCIYDEEDQEEEEDNNFAYNSEDDDVYDLDPVEPASNAEGDTETDEFAYEVLNAEQLTQCMVDAVREVNEVVEIPATATRILLNHFKWDKEKLLGKYYDGDQDELFREAHIVNPYKKLGTRWSYTRSTSHDQDRSASFTCEVCYLDTSMKSVTGLACGHTFCNCCWSTYLTTKIMDDGCGQTIACQAHDCAILVDDLTVMKLVSDPKVKLKYQHLISNTFVECNRLLRWCPQPGCQYAIRVSFPDCRAVSCTCSHVFCFACGENWHDPVKCKMIGKWVKKCSDDSETCNWISTNTKDCPKCQANIEKNGGCNHMTCKKCKNDFCWVCLGPWSEHNSAYYKCNRFEEGEEDTGRDASSVSKGRAALKHYLFYCDRYTNHMKSLKFENKLYVTVHSKMEEMQNQHCIPWIEVQFLKKAVDVLCMCRQTLMNTYVFAYYLKKNNQSIIFEDNQKDLEAATEQLSEYLEKDITDDAVVDIKQKVQDKYNYCESRRNVVMGHVHEGYSQDFWEYSSR